MFLDYPTSIMNSEFLPSHDSSLLLVRSLLMRIRNLLSQYRNIDSPSLTHANYECENPTIAVVRFASNESKTYKFTILNLLSIIDGIPVILNYLTQYGSDTSSMNDDWYGYQQDGTPINELQIGSIYRNVLSNITQEGMDRRQELRHRYSIEKKQELVNRMRAQLDLCLAVFATSNIESRIFTIKSIDTNSEFIFCLRRYNDNSVYLTINCVSGGRPARSAFIYIVTRDTKTWFINENGDFPLEVLFSLLMTTDFNSV